MKAKSTLLTCLLAIITLTDIAAQVVADFILDTSSGCSPLSVKFTDKSTGSGTLTYNWDLGNGNRSTLKDPQAVYSTAGNYVIKLTVSDGVTSSSAQKSIVVFKNPTANFTANSKGCVPINIAFTDISAKGDANITKWNWDFRNGVLSSEPNPVNTYTSAGKFDVFLEVVDANGCKSAIDKPGFVDVVNKPMVSFYATPSTSCTVPATVQFTNQSTGGGKLSYAWDFGGGATSTLANPKHTYNAFGSFNVKLTVSSDYGCNTTLDVPMVAIGEVTASGSLKQGNTTIQNNSIICAGDIDYNNASAGNSNCYWDFGDGTNSNIPSGKHTYTNAGKYKVLLIAAPGDPCADTAVWNITVEKAIAAFTFTPEKSCNQSNIVNFTNQSSDNIVAHKWLFHDATVVTTKDASKTYTQPNDKDQYVIHEPFKYPVRLVVTSTNGCKDSIDKVFSVQQPTALFSASITEGCVPLTVNFTDKSISENPVKNRTWKFGEGQDLTLTSTTASHTYSTPGTYQVKLVVATDDGCTDTSYDITIKAGSVVTPDFSVNNTTICSSQKIEFTDHSPAEVSKWHYFIGGKSVPACPDIANPSFFMRTDIGSLDAKLMVENNGCLSEVIKPAMLKNDGPLGSFNYTVNCSDERSVTFKGTTQLATSFKWDFGDNQTNTTNLDVTHFYATEGNYTVKFITINGACSDTFTRVVKVRDHQPAFTVKAEACAGDVLDFNSQGSHKLYESCTEKYLWNFGDNSQKIRTHKDQVTHVFPKGGNYNVKLYAFYEDGCVDSTTKSTRIYQPKPGFTVNKNQGCSPLPVTFTDTSTPDVHALSFWNWNFGDGNVISSNNKLNTLDNTFENPGEYYSSLTVSDDFGCTATFEMKISTAIPTATFSAVTPTQICTGSEVAFLMDYPDPDSAIWNFGNGVTLKSITQPTKYLFADTGSFNITLKLYKYGCSDEFTYNKYVQVQKANARFIASDTVYNCYPRKIKLTHTAGKNNIINGKWYYGHGNNSSLSYVDTSSYNYPVPGNYRASLEVQTSFGCTDTFSRVIKITGPTGSFGVSPKEACKGAEITYALADTANVHSFEWDLGDGNFSTSNPVKHRYNSVGNKTAKLILYGDKGKCIPPAIEESVHIYEVMARINVTPDTSVCEGTTIEFKNGSQGTNSYKWNFGDGGNSTSENINHLFVPGIYKVALMTEGLHGCKDTAVQYVRVTKFPTLSVSNDTTICLGGAAMLKAVSDKKITWEPVMHLSSASSSTTATPEQDIKYIVFATDTVSGCFRKDSIYVTVQQISQIELIIEDSVNVVAGRPIQITANTQEDATFEWTPADFLSCNNCFNPVSTTRVNTSYVLKVTDKNKCFTVEKKINLKVVEGEKAFDVPSAFTPSGAEPNNIFRVNGYNIKQLLEFKIYNRWGNMVFSSNDMSQGWDGTYQGKAQPVDSYIYTIKIETFDGRIESKTGTLLLLR